MTEWKSLIGKRVLVYDKLSPGKGIIEARVLEVSPSGRYVKLAVDYRHVWVEAVRIEVLEVLEGEG